MKLKIGSRVKCTKEVVYTEKKKEIGTIIHIEPTKTSKKYYSQCDMVVDYINEFGSITSLDAFREFGATRLSGIIYNLKKQGYKIKSVDEGSLNRYGRMVYYARYSFEEEEK